MICIKDGKREKLEQTVIEHLKRKTKISKKVLAKSLLERLQVENGSSWLSVSVYKMIFIYKKEMIFEDLYTVLFHFVTEKKRLQTFFKKDQKITYIVTDFKAPIVFLLVAEDPQNQSHRII